MTFTIANFCFAQEWKLVRSIESTETISAASIDPDGQVYLGTEPGRLQRLEPSSDTGESFSDAGNSEVTLIEAWNRFKVFLFFRDQQKIIFLDRFSTKPISYELSAFNINYAWLTTPGVDNSIWIVSTNYNELRKYNLQTRQQLMSAPLDVDISEITHIRAYQNLLIISDKLQGLLIFDQYGNLLKQEEIPGIEYFQIDAGKLVFLAQDNVHILDPFDTSEHQKIKAPEGAFTKVIVSGNDHYFIARAKILIYHRAHEPR